MGALRYSVWIDAPAAVAWRYWTDLDRIPQWQTGSPRIEDVSGPGDIAGTRYSVRRGPSRSRTTVLLADPPVRYVSRTEALLGLTFTLAADLSAERGGTRLSLEAVTRWPRGLALFGRLVEAAVLSPREATKELANFKALVEREERTG